MTNTPLIIIPWIIYHSHSSSLGIYQHQGWLFFPSLPLSPLSTDLADNLTHQVVRTAPGPIRSLSLCSCVADYTSSGGSSTQRETWQMAARREHVNRKVMQEIRITVVLMIANVINKAQRSEGRGDTHGLSRWRGQALCNFTTTLFPS